MPVISPIVTVADVRAVEELNIFLADRLIHQRNGDVGSIVRKNVLRIDPILAVGIKHADRLSIAVDKVIVRKSFRRNAVVKNN